MFVLLALDLNTFHSYFFKKVPKSLNKYSLFSITVESTFSLKQLLSLLVINLRIADSTGCVDDTSTNLWFRPVSEKKKRANEKKRKTKELEICYKNITSKAIACVSVCFKHFSLSPNRNSTISEISRNKHLDR